VKPTNDTLSEGNAKEPGMSTEHSEFETVREALNGMPDERKTDALAALDRIKEDVAQGRAHAYEAGRLEARLREVELERNRWRDECDEWRGRTWVAEAERSGFKVLVDKYEAHLPELERQRDNLREQLTSLQRNELYIQQVTSDHLRKLRTERDDLRMAMRAEVNELRAQLLDPVGYAGSRELRGKQAEWVEIAGLKAELHALRDELQERRTTERHSTSTLGDTQDALEEWKQAANEAETERDALRDERDKLLAERAKLREEMRKD
jgi:chromosome segregation ATPase